MQKQFLASVIVLLVAAICLAQTHTTTKKRATAVPANANLPTKVTGEGTKTATGLQYWDIKIGAGEKAIRGEKVDVDYTGWLTNGKKFDSSVGTGHPFEFVLGHGDVIKGWDEGVAGMKVGGKRQFRPCLRRARLSRRNPSELNPDFRCSAGGREVKEVSLENYSITNYPI